MGELYRMYRYILLCVTLTGFLLMSQTTSALDVRDDNLLLYFSFDGEDEKTVKDLSSHGNDGTVSGSIDYEDGKVGKALKLSATGEVRAPYIPINNKSFTVTMWVKPTLTGEDQQCVFTQKHNNTSNQSLHYRIYTSGQVRMGFYGNDLDAPGAVKANEWSHICFWCDADSNTRRIYINAESKAQDQNKPLFMGTSGDTIIGSWDGNQRFNGSIDEVTLWDRALSEADINASMLGFGAAVDAADKLAVTWAHMKKSD